MRASREQASQVIAVSREVLREDLDRYNPAEFHAPDFWKPRLSRQRRGERDLGVPQRVPAGNAMRQELTDSIANTQGSTLSGRERSLRVDRRPTGSYPS
jgi:hypothetical protein